MTGIAYAKRAILNALRPRGVATVSIPGGLNSSRRYAILRAYLPGDGARPASDSRLT